VGIAKLYSFTHLRRPGHWLQNFAAVSFWVVRTLFDIGLKTLQTCLPAATCSTAEDAAANTWLGNTAMLCGRQVIINQYR